MEIISIPLRERRTICVGYAHGDIVAAVKDYVTRRGHLVKQGPSYVLGIENDQASADETILTLLLNRLPAKTQQKCRESGVITRGQPSPRASEGQQKFELSYQAVLEALSAAYEANKGTPLPHGVVTLVGLRHNSSCTCQPALTLCVD